MHADRIGSFLGRTFDPELFSLDPGVAHLNHASFGAVPVQVQQAQQALRYDVDRNPMRFFSQRLAGDIALARRRTAEFLGVDADGVVLTFSVSAGIASVLYSLDLSVGDEIVISDHSHPTVLLALDREHRRNGAVVRTVHIPLDADDAEVVGLVSGAVTPGRTRLVILPVVASDSARLMPVGSVGAAMRALGVALLADAAHAPGMLAIEQTGIDADFWVGNLHKWAFAPRGTAVMVVAAQWRDRVEPLIASNRYQEGFPAFFDHQGGGDYTGWLAASSAFGFLDDLGLDDVRVHNSRLAAFAQQVVGGALGLTVDEMPSAVDGLAMTVVPLPPWASTTERDVAVLRRRIYDDLRAEVAITRWNQSAFIRLSAQIYNQADEFEQLADGLPALIPAQS